MNDFRIALEITALGMGLVFGAIILLWWIMNLLTFLTADREPMRGAAELASQGLAGAGIEDGFQAQAAAVAVAIALVEQQESAVHLLIEPPTTIVSAWQLGMRTRQMYQKGGSMRRRARLDH